MPPKSKKPIDEPPANSTRAKTGTDVAKSGVSDATTTSSRKRTADIFDGEIAENAEKVVPRSKVAKAKTAKQTAEVDAGSKPSKVDDPPTETEEAHSGGDLVEAEPTEHAKPKKDRATEGEAAKPGKLGESTKRPKSKKDKATRGEVAKSSKGDKSTEPAKSKKGKATKGEAVRPSKVDGHPVEIEKTHPGGDTVEVEPTEHTEGKKGKTAKGKTAKGRVADETPAELTNPKGKRGRPKKADHKDDAPNVQDDHVETEKTHPGGDRVVVEPIEPAKGKKSKATNGRLTDETPAEPAKAEGKRGRPKKADHKDDAPNAPDDHVQTEKTHPGGDRVEVKPVEPAKGKKGKTTKGDLADEPAAEPTKPKGKSRGSKKADSNDDTTAVQDDVAEPSNAEPAKSKKKATKAAEPKSAGKKTSGKDKSVQSGEKSGSTEQAASKEPQKKGNRTKASSENAKSNAKGTEVAPVMAMDESVFDTLLATDKGKQPVEEAPASTEKSKTAKASKKASKGQPKVNTTAKATAKPEKKPKDAPKVADSAEESAPKSKKRKTPAEHDVDAVKTDVLDPLSDMASAKKKQKKSQPGALGAVGSLLASSVDSAKKTAKAVMGYAGDVTGSAQKSIMEDVTGVAEGVVKEKRKRSKAAPQGTESPKPREGVTREEPSNEDREHAHENEPEDDEASFFGDTEFLKGFESSGDERDGEDVDFPVGKAVPLLDEDKQAKAKAAENSQHKDPGYIYVGRIPHGFYEKEMRAYFQQFGHITNLRLSRNKTTGRSKHFAFMEFQSEEVAKIVAQTMDNYLLFGHILKVKLIPKEQLHPDTFKGANKRFVAVPWAQISGRKLAMPVSREHWEKRVTVEHEKRNEKAKKTREIGYEFTAPLKGVDTVPVKKGKGKKALQDASVEEEQTLITQENDEDGSMVVTEVTKVKKSKSNGKEVEASATTIVKKGKRKADESIVKAQDTVADTAGSVSEPAAKKLKKSKDKATDSVAQAKDAVSEKVAPAVTNAKKTAEKVKKGMK